MPAASAKGYATVRAHVVGRVLLGLNGGRGLWTTFGGKPEQGECLEDTLQRELREELGIRPTAFVRLADRARDWDGRPAAVAVFAVTGWVGEPRNLAPHEHLSIRWFARVSLPPCRCRKRRVRRQCRCSLACTHQDRTTRARMCRPTRFSRRGWGS